MNHLRHLLNELEIKIAKEDAINAAVSKSSVGWHIEHSLLTINMIIEALKKSDPISYQWKFSFIKTLVFTLNKIPRGRAKAPGIVQPKNTFTVETLKKHLDQTKEKLGEFATLQPNNYFEHPFFGKLKLKPTIKFLKIHTRHHLAIINDIIKS